MKRLRILAASALIALSLSLSGCGGGGGGTADGGDTGNDTVISGMATKGPITGTVNIYALNSGGGKGSLLKSAPVKNGSYSASIGSYTGAVIIEATGSYTDEATGKTLTITADTPLRAALAHASGPVSVAVTPLTELAVQKGGALTEAEINAGNKLISGIFNFDIIGTAPVAPTAAELVVATQSQKDYTLAIAALSQLSTTLDKPLAATLAEVAGGISASGMNSQTLSSFQSAAANFIIVNPYNTTGIQDLSGTTLDVMTGKVPATATYTIAIPAGVAENSIKGLQFDLIIPDGLTLRHDSDGRTLPGIVTASTAVQAAQPYLETYYSISTGVTLLSFGLMTATGIGPGALATVTCDVLPGYTAPPATAFSIRTGSGTAVVGGSTDGDSGSIDLIPTIN